MLGRAESCDLRVDRKYLATVHAHIERIAGSHSTIRVANVSSGKNDIVHNGEVAVLDFVMGAGEWFEIGDSRYYALNEEMRLARPTVMEILGLREHHAIDDLLIAAVKDSTRHVVLLGEPGSDQARLARTIHQVSHRRHNQFYVLPDRPKLDSAIRQDLRDACNGIVLVQLYQRGKLDERLVATLVHPDAGLRLVLCARSLDKVEASFPIELVSDAKKITIQPLRKRISEIPELLDHWFIARRTRLRFAALRDELRQSLLSHQWPSNLEELRETADYLVQFAHYRSGRQATLESSITRSAFRGWIKTLNLRHLKFPLVPDRAD